MPTEGGHHTLCSSLPQGEPTNTPTVSPKPHRVRTRSWHSIRAWLKIHPALAIHPLAPPCLFGHKTSLLHLLQSLLTHSFPVSYGGRDVSPRNNKQPTSCGQLPARHRALLRASQEAATGSLRTGVWKTLNQILLLSLTGNTCLAQLLALFGPQFPFT